MKSKFSKKWKSSSQPRKQRKYRANAPFHLRKNFIRINLAKNLRKDGKRNILPKKGDTIKVMRGNFKGKTGKILEIDLSKSKITIEGMAVKKQDGSKANVKFEPSNLQIIEISERKNKVQKKFASEKDEKAKKSKNEKQKEGKSEQ